MDACLTQGNVILYQKPVALRQQLVQAVDMCLPCYVWTGGGGSGVSRHGVAQASKCVNGNSRAYLRIRTETCADQDLATRGYET